MKYTAPYRTSYKLGKNITNPGTYVTINNATNNATMNGQTSLKNSPSGVSVIAQTVNIIEPNGGVRPPIIMLTIQIIPKCTGSTPSLVTTGTSSGARIISAAPPSRNMPKISSRIFTSISIMYGLRVKSSIAEVICCGIRSQFR